MLNPINKDAFTLFNRGKSPIPFEYTGYRDEILASKSTAWLGTILNNSPIFDVKGPDAAKFLTSICINDFIKMKVGSIRHAVLCNEKGQILTDGVVMMIDENTFRTYWLSPVIDYYASITDMNVETTKMTEREFFFQLAGPKSLEILEQASQSDLHDIKFAKHRMANIAGVDVRILRLGMAGTLGYEVHGDMDKCYEVYEFIWEVAQRFGAKKLGQVAYTMNHTEAGFPNINMHYPLPWYETPGLSEYLSIRPMEGYFNLNRKLVGSVGDDLEIRFVTPYDVGWESLIKFDHDFPGKNALEEMSKNPKRTLVTLEWNPDDLGEIFASQFRGLEIEPYETMDDRPMDMYYNSSFSMYYHADKVMAGNDFIGISTGRLNSYYYRKMISLAFIEREYATEGTELSVIWGISRGDSMGAKEAKARIKINDLLREAGWRFFDEDGESANIQVEPNVKMTKKQVDSMGENFDKVKNGYIDFLLLDDKANPFIVLEAKSEDKDPLVGKEQAREYAKSMYVKYVILSNGNQHYFWNIYKGNPQIITSFPSYESLRDCHL